MENAKNKQATGLAQSRDPTFCFLSQPVKSLFLSSPPSRLHPLHPHYMQPPIASAAQCSDSWLLQSYTSWPHTFPRYLVHPLNWSSQTMTFYHITDYSRNILLLLSRTETKWHFWFSGSSWDTHLPRLFIFPIYPKCYLTIKQLQWALMVPTSTTALLSLWLLILLFLDPPLQ